MAKSLNTLSIEVPITRLTFVALTTGELSHPALQGARNLDETTRRRELHDLADRLQSDAGSYQGNFTFPVENIIACLRDDALQSRHSLRDALERHKDRLAESVEDALWFYFESPAWTWENLCGRAGWMVVSKEPMREAAFFLEIMN